VLKTSTKKTSIATSASLAPRTRTFIKKCLIDEAFYFIVLMCGAGDAVNPNTFVLNCQIFRTKMQPFIQNSLARARGSNTKQQKRKSLRTPPTMAMLVLAYFLDSLDS
jgi:hypothetical protein